MRQRLLFSARNGRIGIVAIGIVAVITLPALITRRSAPASFCRICGAQKTQTSLAVRGTSVALFQMYRPSPTPISELLTSRNLVAPHLHQWLAPKSIPDPLDEFGPPVIESLNFISAPRVVSFMRDIAQYGDATSIAQWRGILMQAQYSYVIDGALRFLLMPPTGFASRDEFQSWWSSNGFALQNRLREQTEPD